jgi:hypothetical protein
LRELGKRERYSFTLCSQIWIHFFCAVYVHGKVPTHTDRSSIKQAVKILQQRSPRLDDNWQGRFIAYHVSLKHRNVFNHMMTSQKFQGEAKLLASFSFSSVLKMVALNTAATSRIRWVQKVGTVFHSHEIDRLRSWPWHNPLSALPISMAC